jgi:RNA polymerase sigma factor (sigma-70 family)
MPTTSDTSLQNPFNSLVNALVTKAKANDNRISITDVGKLLHLETDEPEEGATANPDEAEIDDLIELDDEVVEELQSQFDIAEVLVALKQAGIEVSDDIDESKIEDDMAYLARQVGSSPSDSGGDLDARTLLLKELGNHELLTTREAETEHTMRIHLLARTIKDLEKSLEKLNRKLLKVQEEAQLKKEVLDLIADDPDLSAAEKATYLTAPQAEYDAALAVVAEVQANVDNIDHEIKESQRKWRAARDEFLSYNYRLVLSIARRNHQHSGQRVEFIDLVMQGVYGMIDAVNKFDPTRGYKFSTFATWHIRQKISEWSHEQKGAIRVPTHRWRDIRKISRFVADFTAKNDRSPSREEVAAHLGKSMEKIDEIYQAEVLGSPGSIDAPLSTDDESGSLGDLLEDHRALSPEEAVVLGALSDVVQEAFEKVLDARERRVVQLRFGINPFDPSESGRCWTLEEIGHFLGVSRERVRQIEAKALRKLSENASLRDLAGKPKLPPRQTRRHSAHVPPPPRRKLVKTV